MDWTFNDRNAIEKTFHSEQLRNHPNGPHGPKGAEGALPQGPKGPPGPRGPEGARRGRGDKQRATPDLQKPLHEQMQQQFNLMISPLSPKPIIYIQKATKTSKS